MIASSNALNALAWSLLHFLWQGAAIAALAGAWMLVLRRPATRYLLGIGALALMLVCFVATFVALSAGTDAAANLVRAPAAALVSPPDLRANFRLIPLESQAAVTSSAIEWIAWAWLAGVACFALRIVFGLLVLEHLRRRNLVDLPARLLGRFRALQERLGIRRAIRYAQCELVNVPAVIGFFRPIVLVPMRALTGLSEDQLEAVIAHELGHIKRFDVVVNFAQVLAETLLFFHPAVWWLNKRIRADREDCCDDVAVAACGSQVKYARALAVMEEWRDTPHFAMAATGSSVAARVARLLGVKAAAEGRARVVAASMVLTGALIAGCGALGFSPAAWAQIAWQQSDIEEASVPASAAEQATEAAIASGAELALAAAPSAEVESQAPMAPEPVLSEPPPPAPVVTPKAVKPPRPAKPARPLPAAPPVPVKDTGVHVDADVDVDTSFVDEMKGVDLKGEDQVAALVNLKVIGVTGDYVREMKLAGLAPDVNTLISFKTQDVSPEYVKAMRATGLDPNADELLMMKIQSVTPQYVKAMRDAGLDGHALTFISMRVQDVTPEFVRAMRAAGVKPDAQKMIEMRVQDVTPEYFQKMKAQGIALDAESAIQARVFDISPEYVAKVRDHGFKDLTIEKLVALKNADVL
jgi:beta-lactamase regulating signal transducer with metallopeptidase domain